MSAQALKALVMHEVGHTLGLRHNFRGSAGASAAQLANRGWTASHGFGVSVMDYSPPALALDPAQQGDYYAPTIGSYDRWAITYGYADVVPRRSVAGAARAAARRPTRGHPTSRSTGSGPSPPRRPTPPHLYGTDEDAGFGGLGLDPTVSRYDQTDDPLEWARGRVALIDGLFDSLETRVVAPGQRYGRLRAAFTDLLNDRWYALLVDHQVPGRRHDLARPPRRSRRAAGGRQRAGRAAARGAGVSLGGGFGERAYRFRPELLEPARGRPLDALGRVTGRGRAARFPAARLGAGRSRARSSGSCSIPWCWRGSATPSSAPQPGEPTVGLPELFASLTGAIWAEIGAGARGPGRCGRATSRSVRRDVQRLYLNALIQMAVSPPPGTPEDARALARATLAGLGGDLDRALAVPRPDLDAYTRAHLADARERIARALDAQMIQTTTVSR